MLSVDVLAPWIVSVLVDVSVRNIIWARTTMHVCVRVYVNVSITQAY